LNELRDNMDSEMRKYFVGPMPVKEFLDNFLPVEPPERVRDELPGFGKMVSKSESKMYNIFVRSSSLFTVLLILYLQSFHPQAQTANSICSSIKAFNTSKNPSSDEDAKYKPDITFHDTDTPNFENHLASFQRMEMFVEFKRGNTSDPFHTDNHLPFEKLFETTCNTRGQIVLYSTRLQTYQFRTWAFSVGIFGDVARLFRWDRAGAIVSEPISYCEEGNRDLAEFLCRFDRMDRTRRGWDPTVFNATPEEAADFDRAIKTVVGKGENALLEQLFDSDEVEKFGP